jgi:uncharacterized membrane protein YhhN
MSFRVLLIIYGAVLATEIFANMTQNTALQSFSKPSLMLILIFYFLINSRKLISAKFLIISALFFSWLGDVLLFLDKIYKLYFIYGLTFFLAAHIFYIFYFWRMRKINKIGKLPNALLFAGIAAYSLIFFAFLTPNVKNLFIPLSIYGLVISVMLGMSLTAFDFKKNKFGKLCVVGTLLFVLSDSILAINRFVSPFKYAMVFIMLTYAVAQLLITEGSLRNLREIEKAPAK